MKISSGILVISLISFTEGPAEATSSTLGVVLDQFHSIVRDQTETVDLILALSLPAYDPIPAVNYVQLIRIVNWALFNYMQGIYDIVRNADVVREPAFSGIKAREIAQMSNHSAALKMYFENIMNGIDNDLGHHYQFGQQLQLMPVGPPRRFSVTLPRHSRFAYADEPQSENRNLEELMSNLEGIMTSKQRIFEIIQGFMLDLHIPSLRQVGIMFENVNDLQNALFELLYFLKPIARSVPNLVVEDILVKESKKLSGLAQSIRSAMMPLDKNYYI